MPNKKLILSELESSFNFQHVIPPITVINFFSGNLKQVESRIKERWRLIVKKNPWITGRLIKNKDHKRLQLEYLSRDSVSEKHADELFHVNPSELKLHSKLPYLKILDAAKSAIVGTGSSLVNKPKGVTRLTLTADSNEADTKFALILSMSHVVVDGHCFYKIFNMLSNDTEIEEVFPERKEEAWERVVDSVGRKEWTYVNSPKVSMNMLRGVLFGKKPKVFGYYLNDEEINRLKLEAKENGETHFVSTNDILTSRFFNFIKARFALMTINLRKRLPGILDMDGGNYEAVVVYDKDGYNQPSDIRKSLNQGPPYLGTKNPLPGFYNAVFSQMGLITNLASFGRELILQGCKETLHIPVLPMSIIGYEFAVIFRPNDERLGIIFSTKKYGKEDFKNSRIPIGEPVSEEIFGT